MCAVGPVLGIPVSLTCSRTLPSILILLGMHSCSKTPWHSPWAWSCSSCPSSASRHMPAHLLPVMDGGEASPCPGRQLLWLHWGRHSLSPLQARLCLHVSPDALEPFVLLAKFVLTEIALHSPWCSPSHSVFIANCHSPAQLD